MAMRWYSVSVFSILKKGSRKYKRNGCKKLENEVAEVLVPTEEVLEYVEEKKSGNEDLCLDTLKMDMSEEVYHAIKINRVSGFQSTWQTNPITRCRSRRRINR